MRSSYMAITLNINGTRREFDGDPNTPLLWVIREDLGLTGTKYGCGIAQCGACTVHVDGQTLRSCSAPVSAVANRQVTTIEGLSSLAAKAVQKAWVDLDVVQCGYCQSGQIMSAVALLEKKPKATDEDIDHALAGNICEQRPTLSRRDFLRSSGAARIRLLAGMPRFDRITSGRSGTAGARAIHAERVHTRCARQHRDDRLQASRNGAGQHHWPRDPRC